MSCDEKSSPAKTFTKPLYTPSTEIKEEPDPPDVPAKVVSWDVAEGKEVENLKLEIAQHKEKMEVLEREKKEEMEVLENKAMQLQRQLERKVVLAETNISSGVKVAALEYKIVALHDECGYEKFTNLRPKPSCFGSMLDCLGFSSVSQERHLTANKMYTDFAEVTLKKLGEEGWTLRAIHTPSSTPIFDNYDVVWRSQVLYYFSRPI